MSSISEPITNTKQKRSQCHVRATSGSTDTTRFDSQYKHKGWNSFSENKRRISSDNRPSSATGNPEKNSFYKKREETQTDIPLMGTQWSGFSGTGVLTLHYGTRWILSIVCFLMLILIYHKGWAKIHLNVFQNIFKFFIFMHLL